MNPPGRYYTIDPRPDALGGGWKLSLMEGDTEMGGGVFPAGSDDESRNEAQAEAQREADNWIGD